MSPIQLLKLLWPRTQEAAVLQVQLRAANDLIRSHQWALDALRTQYDAHVTGLRDENGALRDHVALLERSLAAPSPAHAVQLTQCPGCVGSARER